MALPRFVILFSGTGHLLEKLLTTFHDEHGAVVGVITHNPGAKGIERAKAHGLVATVVNHRDYASREAFEQELIRAILPLKPDLIILCGFLRILTPLFVRQFSGKIINIHPSLLPHHKGRYPYDAVLQSGDAFHGSTIHFVNDELDGGPIIASVKVAVKKGDSVDTLKKRVKREEQWLYPEIIRGVSEGRIQWQEGKVVYEGRVLPPTGMEFPAQYD